MKNYLSLLETVLNHGIDRGDRTGTGTRSLFSPMELRYDLSKGFPAMTTKKLHFHSVVGEFYGFYLVTQMLNGYKKTKFASGMNGQMKMVI